MTFAIAPGTLVLLAIGIAISVLLIWSVRRFGFQRSRAKATPLEKILGLLSVFFLAVLFWIGWEFQPWMPEGRAVHVADAHFGNHDFQVWQRKNATMTEPFATGLFVRKQGGQWKAFLLDIQDTYRPSIDLREENSGGAILYGKTKRAYFDEKRDVFTFYHHDGSSEVTAGIVIDSKPPGNWWLEVAIK